MKTNYLDPFFKNLISTWMNHLRDIEPSTYAMTDKGLMPLQDIYSDEQKEEKCNHQKEEDFALLNSDEQEIYLKTYYEDLKHYWGISNRAYPSSISTLANQSLSYLESHKLFLINQLIEIDAIISMKTKLKKNDKDESPESQPEEDWI